MPSARVPSATGEQPCASPHPLAPPCSTLCAHARKPSVTRECFRWLRGAWRRVTAGGAGTGRATTRCVSTRCVSGTRTSWAGPRCPRSPGCPGRPGSWCGPCGSPWGCGSTSSTCPRRRGPPRWPGWRAGGAAGAGPWGFPSRCAAAGCCCWWPRAARRSCRGCWSGWSGGHRWSWT